MTASKIFLYFCLSFIGGIFLGSFFLISQLIMLSFLILGIILISVLWKYKNLVIVGFCILFLTLGVWRHNIVELRIMNDELRRLNDSSQNTTLIGIVSDEPDIREKTIKLTIKPETINGKILVTTNRYPEYQYGNKLKITGKLETPAEDIEGFNYKNYLKKDGIYSIISWPKIEVLGLGFGNPIMNHLFSFKNKFKETARTFISPPQIGILEALIFGDEGNISKTWRDKLNFTGSRHITAVSGMNITIIASLLLAFALSLGFRRQQAFYFSIFLLSLYILMIGAPASALRAGIMGGLLLTAQYLGRLSVASRAVIFAATIMLALNPLLLRLDIGFQLSFLAMIGIIYLMPIFQDWLRKIPAMFQLKNILAMTLSAQVFTLPILIYNFGYLSLAAPITNILIVPFLPFIMFLGFISGLAGIIFQPLGWVLSWPTWGLLTYLVKVVDWFSGFSLAYLAIENIHWVWLIVSYSILGIITWRLQENRKLKFLQY